MLGSTGFFPLASSPQKRKSISPHLSLPRNTHAAAGTAHAALSCTVVVLPTLAVWRSKVGLSCDGRRARPVSCARGRTSCCGRRPRLARRAGEPDGRVGRSCLIPNPTQRCNTRNPKTTWPCAGMQHPHRPGVGPSNSSSEPDTSALTVPLQSQTCSPTTPLCHNSNP